MIRQIQKRIMDVLESECTSFALDDETDRERCAQALAAHFAASVRELTAQDVTFELSIEQDDTPVRGNALASGDDEADRDCEAEILRRLDQGDVWAWGLVRITAHWNGFKGTACLGACSYESEKEFIEANDYYADLKDEALAELNTSIRTLVGKLETLQVPS